MPWPPRTRGISPAPTYRRKPGRLTRLRPLMADDLFDERVVTLMDFLRAVAFDGEVGDVAFLLEHARHVVLDGRERQREFVLLRAGGVAQAGQEIGDGIGQSTHGNGKLGGFLAVAEGHAEFVQERLGFLVGAGARDDAHVEPDVALDLVEFDLGKIDWSLTPSV